MSAGKGVAVIAADAIVLGGVRNCARLEVHGRVHGEVAAGLLIVHEGGLVHGNVRADDAEVHGTLQGNVFVRSLISIAASGSVNGSVRYGRLALKEGGSLSADVQNVPPGLTGDLQLHVRRGRSVRVTTADLAAYDPDDQASALTFSVSAARNGFVALSKTPAAAVTSFTQKDVEAGEVLFVHDGSPASEASFDVVVTDSKGGRSGEPRTVKAAVADAA